jgi:hypothetical protein
MRPLITILVLCSSVVKASFWQNCWFINTDDIDPTLRSPSTYTNDFFASTKVRARSFGGSLIMGPCTSCAIRGDYSAYWLPTLRYRFRNRTETQLLPRMTIMYNFNTSIELINVMPVDLRLVVGDLKAEDNKSPRVTFTLTGDRYFKSADGNFPEEACSATGLTVNIPFPSCLVQSLYTSF